MPSAYYVFSPLLNATRAFLEVSPKDIDMSRHADVPFSVDNLTAHIRADFTDFSSDLLNKHVGEQSTYTLKTKLIESLHLIDRRLSGKLDHQLGVLSANARAMILYKLHEEITECTPGFHIRVNELVHALKRMHSLGALLTNVRNNIAMLTAISLTNEIHNYNSVSLIAASEGLGVRANFKEDVYTGRVSKDMTKIALKEKFEKQYTPFRLPALLADALRASLVEFGYDGCKQNDESYCQKEVTDIACCITSCLQDDPEALDPQRIDWQPFFILEEKDEDQIYIRDVNWRYVKRRFFEALLKEHYLSYQVIPVGFEEQALYASFVDTPTDILQVMLGRLITLESHHRKDALHSIYQASPEVFEQVSLLPHFSLIFDHLPDLIQNLPEDVRLRFLMQHGYDSDPVKLAEWTNVRLVSVLMQLNAAERLTLVSAIGKNMSQIIGSTKQLLEILRSLRETKLRHAMIAAMHEHLDDFIPDHASLMAFFKCFPRDDRCPLMLQYIPNVVRHIQTIKDLIDLIANFSSQDAYQFLLDHCYVDQPDFLMNKVQELPTYQPEHGLAVIFRNLVNPERIKIACVLWFKYAKNDWSHRSLLACLLQQMYRWQINVRCLYEPMHFDLEKHSPDMLLIIQKMPLDLRQPASFDFNQALAHYYCTLFSIKEVEAFLLKQEPGFPFGLFQHKLPPVEQQLCQAIRLCLGALHHENLAAQRNKHILGLFTTYLNASQQPHQVFYRDLMQCFPFLSQCVSVKQTQDNPIKLEQLLC